MSKEALYARISACKQEIEWNQKEIVKLEAKIEEYEYIRAKVMRGADNLCDFCNYQSRKISDTKNRHQKVKFLDAYIEDMTGYLQGRDYCDVMDRFVAAGNRLWNKRDLAIERIDFLRRGIYRLEEEIGMLEAQIREIERQEEEARRAAEEAESLYQKADLFEQNLGQLVTMLEVTLDDALIHGMVATNLARFLEEVRSLQTEAEEIALQLKEGVVEYVAEIDTADNYLY